MFKTSHWAKLKRVLSAEGVAITTPLFHTTRIKNAEKILAGGFKARAGGPMNDAYKDNSICFTRNLCFSEQEWFHDSEVIFVLDLNKLKNRFQAYPYDIQEIHQQKTPSPLYMRKEPERFEFETRFSRSPKTKRDFTEKETVIPPKYIEAIIVDDRYKGISLYSNNTPMFFRFDNNQYSYASDYYKKDSDEKLFIEAAQTGSVLKVKAFIDSGIDVQIRNNLALSEAVNKNNLAVVKLLLEHGANANDEEQRILANSCRRGNINMIKTLLQNGADVHIARNHPLRVAAVNNKKKVVQLLLEYGADVNDLGPALLEQTYKEGNLDIIDLLLEHGADTSANIYYGYRALIEAVESNNYKMVKDLLDRGFDVNYEVKIFNYITNPLIAAIINSPISMLDLLLSYGADVSNEKTLRAAYESGMDSKVQWLIEHGADPSLLETTKKIETAIK